MIPVTLTDLHMYLMGCQCGEGLFCSGEEIVKVVTEMVERSGLEPLKAQYHDFPGGGTTAVVLLAESHVAVHTWPETNRLAVVDVSVCNYTGDNRKKTYKLRDLIIKAYQPTDKVVHEADPTPRTTEYTAPGVGYFAEVDQYLVKQRSQFQKLAIFQNRTLGKVLVLDDLFQTSEKDEFFYHEAMVHPAMLAHENPEKVLILGGGDLGAAEEVLKYPSVKRVFQIDIDQEVVEICKKELTGIHHDCYKDERFEIAFQDGYEYMMNEGEIFDVLIMDLTDPIGVCERLYTQEFYRGAWANHMKKGSIMACHQGFPFYIPKRCKHIYGNLKQVFPDILSFSNTVPLYGGPMLYALCGDGIRLPSPDVMDAKLEAQGIEDLQYATGASVQGMFGLPRYLMKLLETG